MKNIYNVIGWVGALLIIIAYLLVSFGYVAATNLWYQVINLVGAVGIVLSSYRKKDMQPVVLNIFWILISLLAITKLLF